MSAVSQSAFLIIKLTNSNQTIMLVLLIIGAEMYAGSVMVCQWNRQTDGWQTITLCFPTDAAVQQCKQF